MQIRYRERGRDDPIDNANLKSDEEFLRDHIALTGEEFTPWKTTWSHPSGSEKTFGLALVRAESMTEADLTACLDMIELTSSDDYWNSTVGWNRDRKLREMKSWGLRYILVRDPDGGGAVAAFTSFMPTYEEGQPVVYCYEIHLLDQVRRAGLGKLLLGYLSNVVASLPPVEKVMLTCFVANEGGRAFYERIGFEKDAISPEPRRLRNGETRRPDYLIMSKRVVDRRRPLADS